MSTPNPFVVAPVDTATPLSGTLLLEDGDQLASALASGDWVAGGMAAFSTVMDSLAMASDPLGQLFAMGFGWLLEHVQPLKGWLNQLTGDAGQVGAFAQSWSFIQQYLAELADELPQMASRDLAGMAGDWLIAYEAYIADLAALTQAAGRWSQAMSVALQIASTLVQMVHDIVRDAIAQVAGAICSYAAELALTVGLATPLVIEQAATKTAEITSRICGRVHGLVDSGEQLAKHSDELAELMGSGAKKLRDGKIDIRPYGDLKLDHTVPGQAHHLNQNAAFRQEIDSLTGEPKELIPRDDGLSIKLEGNILTDAGSPHWRAHKSLEEFWDEFRAGGAKSDKMPTVGEYNAALTQSLKAAGLSPEDIDACVKAAIKQQLEYGLKPDSFVPKVPGRIPNLAKLPGVP